MTKIIIAITAGDLILNTEDVSHISAKGDRYCWLVYHDGKKNLIHSHITQMMEFLPCPPFYQINENTIIHIDQMKQILTKGRIQIVLLSGASFLISAEMLERLGSE